MRASRVQRAGFTLIELMIAVSILVIITGIVYSSFTSVADSTEEARVAAEQMRLRQFLTRQLTTNLSQAYADWRPGASMRDPEAAEDIVVRTGVADNTKGSPVEEEELENVRYWLEGIDDDGPDGPADTLSFTTTARLSGGASLPGVLKQVTYEVVDSSETDETLLYLEDDSRVLMLQCTETPIFEVTAEEGDGGLSGFKDTEDFMGEIEVDTPGWSVPISSMNIQYYDGLEEEWVDDWDSVALAQLPWAIRFDINFARPPEESDGGFNAIDDPDLRLVISLPEGMGLTEPPPLVVHREEDYTGQGNSGGGNSRGGSVNDPDDQDADDDRRNPGRGSRDRSGSDNRRSTTGRTS